jgi:hypothetical protein
MDLGSDHYSAICLPYGKDRFFWPKSTEEVVRIGRQELAWRQAGLDFTSVYKQLTYSIAA